MNCNQFCLCRLQHSDVNYCKFCILEGDHEKQLFNVNAIMIHDGGHISFVVMVARDHEPHFLDG